MSHYRCVVCHQGELEFDRWESEENQQGVSKCTSCGETYELRQGVLKGLAPEPPKHYYDELSYARRCLGMSDLDWNKFCILREKRQYEFKNLLAHRLNFDGIVESLKNEIPKNSDVLQICCRDSLHYLNWFKENGHNTWGCDQYIHIGEGWDDLGAKDDPRFCAADPGNLPYKTNSFDVIILSHALIHFWDLDKGCHEVWRILKPGGTVVILNEQMRGLFTPTVKYDDMPVMPHPREKRYWYTDYIKALTNAGFHEMQLYFPEYQHQQLKLTRVSPFTFKILSILLRPFWRIPNARRFIRQNLIGMAYAIIGFPLQLSSRKVEEDSGKGKKMLPPVDTPDTLTSRLPQRGDVGERRRNNKRGTDRRKKNTL